MRAWFKWPRITLLVGFLSDDSSTEEFFVHYTNIKVEGFKTLTAGQLVSYSVGHNHRGPQAVEVEVIGEAEPE